MTEKDLLSQNRQLIKHILIIALLLLFVQGLEMWVKTATLAKDVVECFNRALRVFTEQAYPTNWAYTQRILGLTYTMLYEETQNSVHRENAITALQAARRGYERLGQTETVVEIDERLKTFQQER